MRKIISPLLLRLAVVALTFFAALIATLVWQKLPKLPSPLVSSAEAFLLSPASVEVPLWPEQAKQGAAYWIIKRKQLVPEFDVNRPVAMTAPNADLVVFGCGTLTVSVDAGRRLVLNGADVGSLDDPSEVAGKFTEFFHERELVRAYRPGMEDRTDLPLSERIEKTVVIAAPASAEYGEVAKLVSIVEHAGANPIVLQIGGDTTP